MLFLFIFMPAMFAALQGAVCGIVGYVWKQDRWVYGVGDYFMNLAWMALQTAAAAGIIWQYTVVFGWPEPE